MIALLSLLRNIGSALGFNIGSLWTALKSFLGTKWVLVILVAGIVYEIITNGVNFGVYLGTLVAGMVFRHFDLSVPAGAWNALAICNTFFPLQEFFVLLISYGVWLGGWTLYKHSKTMVPAFLPGGGGS